MTGVQTCALPISGPWTTIRRAFSVCLGRAADTTNDRPGKLGPRLADGAVGDVLLPIGISMLCLTGPQMDRIVAHRFTLLCWGIAFMGLPFALPRGWGLGLFSGFMLFCLGVYGVAFRKWRTEPGLWMLAVLLTVTLGPCWAYFEFLNCRALLDRKSTRLNSSHIPLSRMPSSA